MVNENIGSRSSRRTFIKTCGAAALAVSASSSIGAAKSETEEPFLKLRGSLSDPITRDEIRQEKQRVLKESSTSGQQFGALPSTPSAKVLAYNFFIDEEDNPREQILTSNPTFGESLIASDQTQDGSDQDGGSEPLKKEDIDIQAKHQKADSWIEDPPNENSQAQSDSSGSNVAASSGDEWSDWETVTNVHTEHDSEPHGIIIYDISFKRKPDDNVFAMDVGVELESGKNRVENADDDNFDKRWQNKEGFLTQDWNQDNWANMKDRHPRTNKSNEVSNKTITLGADSDSTFKATVSKTYSQPETEVLEKSSKTDNVARHHLTNAANSDPALWTCFFNPSSISIVSTDCSDGFVDMVEADFKATWGDTNFLGQWVSHQPTDSITYTMGSYCGGL